MRQTIVGFIGVHRVLSGVDFFLSDLNCDHYKTKQQLQQFFSDSVRGSSILKHGHIQRLGEEVSEKEIFCSM